MAVKRSLSSSQPPPAGSVVAASERWLQPRHGSQHRPLAAQLFCFYDPAVYRRVLAVSKPLAAAAAGGVVVIPGNPFCGETRPPRCAAPAPCVRPCRESPCLPRGAAGRRLRVRPSDTDTVNEEERFVFKPPLESMVQQQQQQQQQARDLRPSPTSALSPPPVRALDGWCLALEGSQRCSSGSRAFPRRLPTAPCERGYFNLQQYVIISGCKKRLVIVVQT